MLWLIVFISWSLRVAMSGHAAAQPAMKVILFLIAILGLAQIIVSTIVVLEYIMAISTG